VQLSIQKIWRSWLKAEALKLRGSSGTSRKISAVEKDVAVFDQQAVRKLDSSDTLK
jgi:hypothetical protein